MTAPDPHASLADIEMLTAALGHVFAPWVQELDLRVLEARADDELACHATTTCTLL